MTPDNRRLNPFFIHIILVTGWCLLQTQIHLERQFWCRMAAICKKDCFWLLVEWPMCISTTVLVAIFRAVLWFGTFPYFHRLIFTSTALSESWVFFLFKKIPNAFSEEREAWISHNLSFGANHIHVHTTYHSFSSMVKNLLTLHIYYGCSNLSHNTFKYLDCWIYIVWCIHT